MKEKLEFATYVVLAAIALAVVVIMGLMLIAATVQWAMHIIVVGLVIALIGYLYCSLT